MELQSMVLFIFMLVIWLEDDVVIMYFLVDNFMDSVRFAIDFFSYGLGCKMALVSRIGNMLKQASSRNVSVESSLSNLSLCQAVRSMSSKLFVGGLPYSIDDVSLREAFAQHGEVTEARVIIDHSTGRSRGFGFVSYTSSEDATSAKNAMYLVEICRNGEPRCRKGEERSCGEESRWAEKEVSDSFYQSWTTIPCWKNWKVFEERSLCSACW